MPASNLRSPIVLDTTVVSNFAFTGDLDLVLNDPNTEVVTVPAVIDEIRTGDEDSDFLAEAREGLSVIEVESGPESGILDRLDYGEAHALHAAIVEEGTLATDDLPARELADQRGVPVTGSIGLLVRLVRYEKFTVNEADAVLRRWIEGGGYFSPVESVREVLPDDWE